MACVVRFAERAAVRERFVADTRRLVLEAFKVGVIGAGYVGLVTGACLAHVGHRVTCVDKDEGRVAELNEGRVPFYEPGLEDMISRARKRLLFTTELPEVVREADVVFVAVNTPMGEDGSADLSSVSSVGKPCSMIGS